MSSLALMRVTSGGVLEDGESGGSRLAVGCGWEWSEHTPGGGEPKKEGRKGKKDDRREEMDAAGSVIPRIPD